MTTLTSIRGNVRIDLHDEDASNYRWTDDTLDRHIAQAVREFSLDVPVESKTTLTTTADSRQLSISTLTDLIEIAAVEYPTGNFPPTYVRHSIWGATLTLLGEDVPSGVENVDVYWYKLHTLSSQTSTLPTWAEDLVALGAAAMAAIEWASYATNRVNVGGEDIWKRYLDWGTQRLREFREELRRLGIRGRVRSRRLYTPALPSAGQTRDWGP